MKRSKKSSNAEKPPNQTRETKKHETSSSAKEKKKEQKLEKREPETQAEPKIERVGHWKPEQPENPSTNFLKTDGNTLTCIAVEKYSARGLSATWMDGKGVKSGEHYWTFTFGGIKEETPILGLTSDTLLPTMRSPWDWKGLLYNGVLLLIPGSDAGADFGPRIWSGDTVGVLATFKENPGHLKLYFYHNNRCLGLGYDMLSSFLSEGIRPFVELKDVGNWVKIEKHTQFPDTRIRDPVEKFGVTGRWMFKTLLDKNRPVHLGLRPTGHYYLKIDCDQSCTNFDLYMKLGHDVSFLAKGKGKNPDLWRKTESIYDFDPEDIEPVKNSEYKDYPLVQVVERPDAVVLKGKIMKIIKGSATATFEREVKPLIFKGDPFKRHK